MTIKANEVAYLKTTGEPVFVLEIMPEGMVDVRRPSQGQNGIDHHVETFRNTELETLEEQRSKFMSEKMNILEKYGPKAAAAPGSEDFGLLSN